MFTERPARGRGQQHGIASMELVLFLPIFLILLLIPIHLTGMFHVKLEVLADSRLLANLPAYMQGANSFDFDRTRYGFNKLKVASRPEGNGQWRMVGRMRAAGRSPGNYARSDELTQVLGDAALRYSRADADTVYQAHSELAWGLIPVSARAAVLRNPLWLRRDLPIGYDNFMHETLDSRRMFNDFFPCESGDVASARKSGGC